MLSLLPLCSSFSPAGGVPRAVLPRARPLMVSTLTSTEAIEYLSTSEQSIEAQLAALKSKVEISKLATEEAEAQYAALKNEEIELLQRIQDQAGDRLRELARRRAACGWRAGHIARRSRARVPPRPLAARAAGAPNFGT